MSSRKRILVFHIGHIGDTLMILPSLWLLREALPSASFFLLSDKVIGQKFTPSTAIFENTDFFKRCLYFFKLANGKVLHLLSMLLLFPVLWMLRFDAVAYLVPSNRTKHQIRRDALYFKLMGIKNRWGLNFQTTDVTSGTPEYQMILNRLYADDFVSRRLSMDLMLSQQERNQVDRWLQQNSGLPKDALIIGFGPGSKMSSKQWPLTRFYRVGKQLINEFSIFPIVFGGKDDAECGKQLVQRWGRGLNGAGALSVRQSAELLRRCHIYVGNDTGTMHLAAAVGTPCVAIFSARDIPGKWAPFGDNHIVLRASVECELCKLQTCSHITCLKNIHTDQVLAAVQTQMDKIRIYG